MSKKNKKSTRRNLLAADVEKERKEQEARQKKLAKKATKLEEASKAITKEKSKKKNKTFRIRKGVRVGGIVVKDAESKKKALKVLAAREALKMDVDSDDGGKAGARKCIKVGGGVRLKQAAAVKPKKTIKATKQAAAAGHGAGAMDIE